MIGGAGLGVLRSQLPVSLLTRHFCLFVPPKSTLHETGLELTPTSAAQRQPGPARLASPSRGTSWPRRSNAVELAPAGAPSAAACRDGNDSGQRGDACPARRPR